MKKLINTGWKDQYGVMRKYVKYFSHHSTERITETDILNCTVIKIKCPKKH
jgi:hypothetical protein